MKKNKLSLFIFLISLISSCTASKHDPIVSIIPRPLELHQETGSFSLSEKVSIIATRPELIAEANYLAKMIQEQTGLQLNVHRQVTKNPTIIIKLNPDISHPEAYHLHSSKEKIQIEAKTRHGVFNALQSLLQLIPIDTTNGLNLPLVEIEDSPRFLWRGIHLDVSRHFYNVDYIKKLLDVAAMHKINVFHWHLTDDQGWRIEIKKYPELTELGAWRSETKIGHMADLPHRYDGIKYGGFYTQEQIKEVVAYAKSRYITIVPEIEMPGHAQAVLASYPHLGCFNEKMEAMKLWGISDNVFCAGKDSSFTFLEDVLTEVIDLFPGRYIHIGGDECPKKNWKNCENCQKRIQAEGLKDEHELQSYFIKRIERFLSSKGKKLIGWDEILEGGLADGAAVMSWRGEKGGIEAANLGHKVVMTPTQHCYFDYYQSTNANEPLAIGGLLDLEKVYSYNPIPKELPLEKHPLILGTQANVWTEYIASEKKLEYMLFPRLCAISEVQWTNLAYKDFSDFLKRMDSHYLRLAAKKVHFRVPTPEGVTPMQVYADSSAIIKFDNTVSSATIRYTTDGSEPNMQSPQLSPFEISLRNDIELKAASFLSNGQKSNTVTSILKRRVLNPVKLNKPQAGLDLSFYNGPYKSFKEIHGEPFATQKVNWLVVPPNTMQNFKGWIYEGYMLIKEPGTYLFELSSDCGSGLYIDNELVIDNDGSFYTKNKQCKVELQTGYYPITVKYFSSMYGKFVRLYCKKPGSDKMIVFPGEQYFRKISE